MNYLAFDLEIYKPLPTGETDWKAHMPLGVSCAATLASNEDKPLLWYADDYGAMSKEELTGLLAYMDAKANAGYKILTWNGLSFDFAVMANETGLHDLCVELAMNHIDMMIHFFCVKGFPVGLGAVAKGCGLPGKTEGVDGAKAPEMWANGEYAKVLEYVGQDVVTTLQVAQVVERQRGFSWTAKSGRLNSVDIPVWLTVADAMMLPEPDNSWMTAPWPRHKFTEWMRTK
jgi:hypothetical protein